MSWSADLNHHMGIILGTEVLPSHHGDGCKPSAERHSVPEDVAWHRRRGGDITWHRSSQSEKALEQ